MWICAPTLCRKCSSIGVYWANCCIFLKGTTCKHSHIQTNKNKARIKWHDMFFASHLGQYFHRFFFWVFGRRSTPSFSLCDPVWLTLPWAALPSPFPLGEDCSGINNSFSKIFDYMLTWFFWFKKKKKKGGGGGKRKPTVEHSVPT